MASNKDAQNVKLATKLIAQLVRLGMTEEAIGSLDCPYLAGVQEILEDKLIFNLFRDNSYIAVCLISADNLLDKLGTKKLGRQTKMVSSNDQLEGDDPFEGTVSDILRQLQRMA